MHIRERKEELKITINFRKFRICAGSRPRKLRSPVSMLTLETPDPVVVEVEYVNPSVFSSGFISGR